MRSTKLDRWATCSTGVCGSSGLGPTSAPRRLLAGGHPPTARASSRVMSINLSPALQAPARHSQFCGQLLGPPNPRFQHPNGITLKLFVKAPAKFTPWFLSVLFHGFRSSLHLSARSKTLHTTPAALPPIFTPCDQQFSESGCTALPWPESSPKQWQNPRWL